MIIGLVGDERGSWANKIVTWSAFDHASHAPQVKACNYYVYVHMYYFLYCGKGHVPCFHVK